MKNILALGTSKAVFRYAINTNVRNVITQFAITELV
jgi:hypothetical protein